MCAILCGYCAEGQQAQPDAQQSPPAPAQQSPPAPSGGTSSSTSSSAPAPPSERRFTGGITLTVLGLSLIPGRTTTDNNSTEISTEYQTTGASERIGYGLTVQARIINHFYLDLSGLIRRIGYQETTTVSTTTTAVLNGSTYPSTTTTSTHEDTRARLIDIPFLVRYYGTGKRPTSPRWFLEAGGTWRLANQIRTSIDSTDASGNVTCCTTTPAIPKHRSGIGMVVGAGMQFVDEFGIHVVPEVRYTRWLDSTFENLSTTTDRNQVEADISLTF
ncbi:MAG: outer membrane beta-barrel protein [Bryobacteraceae bacterium]